MHFPIALVLLIVSAGLANAADVQHGETLAKRWCRSCHVVSAEQKRASTQAAPFSEIAKTRNFDAAKLALFLLAPHPRMPDMNLTRAEAADLAAYIVGQK
jgi:mono/diheme cytochrome c family protein